ncbi:hypothetical protein PF003_g22296 [Phytophthora fragariae]|nr:hypothetical protein PF003_g22296 [Phytophthora fragariae]
MSAAKGKKKDHEDMLARLVRDLESKKTLCRVKDYAGVSLEQLNQHVQKLGPLVHPTLGEQPGFFVDEGRFIPFRTVVFGRCVIAPHICKALLNWAGWSGHGGRVTDAGDYVLDGTTLRVPDVAYVPRDEARQLTEAQQWTRGGEPFAPTFVVEIDTLTGPDSKLDALDDKMRLEYFPHGVQLGWLIDPKNKIMNPDRHRKKKLISCVVYDCERMVNMLLMLNRTVLKVLKELSLELDVEQTVRTINSTFDVEIDDAVTLDKAAVSAVPVLFDGLGNRHEFVKMDATLWIKKPKLFGANFQPGEDHVLVVAAKGGKRHRSNEWFPESSHPLKKRRVGEERRFFDTKDFPPLLAHLKVESKTIVEREAYVVIFA